MDSMASPGTFAEEPDREGLWPSIRRSYSRVEEASTRFIWSITDHRRSPKLGRNRADLDVGANPDRKMPLVIGVPDHESLLLVPKKPASQHLRLHGHGLERSGSGADELTADHAHRNRIDLAIRQELEVVALSRPQFQGPNVKYERKGIEDLRWHGEVDD